MAPRRIDPSTLPKESALAQRLLARGEPTARVTISHDGETMEGVDGEPLALTLLAAGRTTLARSSKYHRPRSAACLQGGCDGCLVRVNGVPDVMACRTSTRQGLTVVSQNAFPSVSMDLGAASDWFFPRYMDHHHWMVSLGPAFNRTMQSFARRMSGLGTLPDEASPVLPAQRETVDVLVVGAGPSGVAASNALVSAGFDVLCVDEESRVGGSTLDDPGAVSMESLDARVRHRPSASVVATYDDGTIVQTANGVTVVTTRARLFATGCRDLIGAFVQNDLPGIYTVRAFGRALCAGVLLGQRVVLVGDDPIAGSICDAARAAGATVVHTRGARVREARGSRSVKGVIVESPGGDSVTHGCDALVVTGEVAAYELVGQAGAALHWDATRDTFAPVVNADGTTGTQGVYVTGKLRATMTDPAARAEDGRRVATRIARDLGRTKGEQ